MRRRARGCSAQHSPSPNEHPRNPVPSPNTSLSAPQSPGPLGLSTPLLAQGLTSDPIWGGLPRLLSMVPTCQTSQHLPHGTVMEGCVSVAHSAALAIACGTGGRKDKWTDGRPDEPTSWNPEPGRKGGGKQAGQLWKEEGEAIRAEEGDNVRKGSPSEEREEVRVQTPALLPGL